jgi:hypothetical protein
MGHALQATRAIGTDAAQKEKSRPKAAGGIVAWHP